jgi:hypothetical protein
MSLSTLTCHGQGDNTLISPYSHGARLLQEAKMNVVIMTLWLCVAAQPQCLVTDDPTGPPITREGPPSIEGCEAHVKLLLENAPPPQGLIARYTCEWKGTEI